MKITRLVEELERVREKHGDIEVTVTASLLSDGYSLGSLRNLPDVFESTCENLILQEEPAGCLNFKRVRLYF